MSVWCVVPVYNRADRVADAVASALRQSEVDLRAVVVDHGSTDGSGDVARDVGQCMGRVEVLRLDRRPGERSSASRPLTAGFARVLGEAADDDWVVRLDADDVFADDCVVHDMTADRHCSLASGLIVFYDVDGMASTYGPAPRVRHRRALQRGGAYAMAHHATFVRVGVVRRVARVTGALGGSLFDSDLGYGEDLDWTLRLLATLDDGDLTVVDRVVMYKFLGAGTITSSVSRRSVWADHRRIFDRHPELSRLLRIHVAVHLAADWLGPLGRPARRLCSPATRYATQSAADFGSVAARLTALRSIEARRS